MNKQPKTSLKLPIFLIVGPALAIVLSIIIYAIVNFALSGLASDTSTEIDSMNISDGASISQGADGESFGDDSASIFRTISNVLLFLVSSISVLAFVPCLIFGIIILNKRRSAHTDDKHPATKNKARDWEDLE